MNVTSSIIAHANCVNHVYYHANHWESSWFVHIWKEILSFKMIPCLWILVKNWGHRSYLKIYYITLIHESQCHQESMKIAKNHWESISDWFKNHEELPRITENQFQTDLRITEDQWESPRINFRLIQESLRIAKNHQESISDLFKNHWELPRIKNQFQTFSRITENHQESLRINFRLIWESPMINENHQE